MTDRMTADQYRLYLTLSPEQQRQILAQSDLKEALAPTAKPARAEKRIDTGRHHRVIIKREDVGVTFDSLTEERRYDWLLKHPEVVHIDIHPIFNLPGGIRYTADFLVWRDLSDPENPKNRRWMAKKWPWVEDVKARGKLTTDFKRIRKLFNATHPLAPLHVVQWVDGEWKECP